jgi:hypothetical protein
MVCRSGKTFNGPWGTPAMYTLEGGSFGFQLGGESTDVVFLVMNTRGVDDGTKHCHRETDQRSGIRSSFCRCAGEECAAQRIEENGESMTPFNGLHVG